MELFNSLIQDTKALLEQGSPKAWDYSERDCWHEIGSSELVLQKDAAYEMGAAGKGSANYVLFTSSPKLVDKDQVLLYGPDLKEIKGDCDFARIVLLRVGVLDDDNDKVYRILKDIEFAKYHVYPEGYMVRMSPENQAGRQLPRHRRRLHPSLQEGRERAERHGHLRDRPGL